MRHSLTIHPAFACDALRGLSVEVERREPGRLLLRYRLTGITDRLVLPPASCARTDGLWKHTCLEAFVQGAGDAGYRELNLSPGGAWAAYRFNGYRAGMADADIGPPDIRPTALGDHGLDMLAIWDLDLPPDRPWRIGVAAVIEEAGGGLSYWALAHPPSKPDFHHADGFALDLPAPSRP